MTHMQLITIGRALNCDIRINDPLVADVHCQILLGDDGNYVLVDSNSLNGTYVNGMRCYGEVRLNRTDIIRIGDTTLPWQTYFSQQAAVPEPMVSSAPVAVQNSGNYDAEGSGKSVLGICSLVLSIIGILLLAYCAIRLVQWGIFAWIGGVATFAWISVGVNILAFILGVVANHNNSCPSKAAAVAKWISAVGFITVIGFFVYMRFINPDTLNPFNNVFKGMF